MIDDDAQLERDLLLARRLKLAVRLVAYPLLAGALFLALHIRHAQAQGGDEVRVRVWEGEGDRIRSASVGVGDGVAWIKIDLTLSCDDGTTTTFTTDETGNYTAPFLVPGTYAVEVEMQGFKKWVRSDIVLEVNQRARVDALLEVDFHASCVGLVGAEQDVAALNVRRDIGVATSRDTADQLLHRDGVAPTHVDAPEQCNVGCELGLAGHGPIVGQAPDSRAEPL